MSLVPVWKTCPMCNKKYSWNPDVGKINCPHCGGLGKVKTGLFKKKGSNNPDLATDSGASRNKK